MNKVKFTQMKDGDKEDYELLIKFEEKHIKGTANGQPNRKSSNSYRSR